MKLIKIPATGLLVACMWNDAFNMDGGWTDWEKKSIDPLLAGRVRVYTVGWIVCRDTETLLLAATKSYDEDDDQHGVSNMMNIPIRSIVRIHRIKYKP